MASETVVPLAPVPAPRETTTLVRVDLTNSSLGPAYVRVAIEVVWPADHGARELAMRAAAFYGVPIEQVRVEDRP
jgi:hypothetical protein